MDQKLFGPKINRMTPEKVLAALSNVQEPDLGKDIVTLNMVKDIVIEGKYVSFTVVLTTPACPMKDHIKNACINAVKLLVDKEATVNVRFDAHTTTHRKDAREVLPKVRNIIAVVSGKGGGGKRSQGHRSRGRYHQETRRAGSCPQSV